MNVTGLNDVVRKLVGTNGVLSEILAGRSDISEMFNSLTTIDLGEVEKEIISILSKVSTRQPKLCRGHSYI